MSQHRTIPIQRADAVGQQPACGGCLHSVQGPVCRGAVGQACAADAAVSRPAELIGPRDEVRRLIAALAARLGFPADAPEAGGVRRLQVQPGEVELQLAAPSACSGSELAEAAFDTLRGLLRDTDIYVLPVAA